MMQKKVWKSLRCPLGSLLNLQKAREHCVDLTAPEVVWSHVKSATQASLCESAAEIPVLGTPAHT